MKKAEKVWEYSQVASNVYSKYCGNKLFWVPMPFVCIIPESKYLVPFDNCVYDLFFFGHKNKRRLNIIKKLEKYFLVLLTCSWIMLACAALMSCYKIINYFLNMEEK